MCWSITPGLILAGGINDTTLDDWQWVLGVNPWGVIHGCHFFVPKMLEQAKLGGPVGHVVNVSSAFGYYGGARTWATAPASSRCLACESLRNELEPHGIGVSVICPGVIDTDIISQSCIRLPPGRDPERMRDRVQKLYKKRNYPPEHVAEAIVQAVRCRRSVVPVTGEAWLMADLARVGCCRTASAVWSTAASIKTGCGWDGDRRAERSTWGLPRWEKAIQALAMHPHGRLPLPTAPRSRRQGRARLGLRLGLLLVACVEQTPDNSQPNEEDIQAARTQLVAPDKLPTLRYPVNAVLTGPGEARIVYLGMDADSESLAVGKAVTLSHYFRVEKPAPEGWRLFVHIDSADAGGRRSHFTADHVPMGGKYPVARWQAGEIIRDSHRVALPPAWVGTRRRCWLAVEGQRPLCRSEWPAGWPEPRHRR